MFALSPTFLDSHLLLSLQHPSTSTTDSQEPASPEKPKKKIVEDAQLEFHACLITSEKDWQTSVSQDLFNEGTERTSRIRNE